MLLDKYSKDKGFSVRDLIEIKNIFKEKNLISEIEFNTITNFISFIITEIQN